MSSSDHQNPDCSKQSPMTNIPRPSPIVVIASVILFVVFAVYSLFFYVPEIPVFKLASISINGLNSSAIDQVRGLVSSSMEVSFGIQKLEPTTLHIYTAEVTVVYGRRTGLARSFEPAALRIETWQTEAELKMELDMNAFDGVDVAEKIIRDYRKNKTRRVGVLLLLQIQSSFSTGGWRMANRNYDIDCGYNELVFNGSNARLVNPDHDCTVYEKIS